MGTALKQKVSKFLRRFDDAIASKNLGKLSELLADDVELAPPPHWTSVVGKRSVSTLLGAVFSSIEDFSYKRRWVDDLEIALEFTGRIGDKQLQGIDLITLDQSGQIKKVDVLMRPLSGIEALRKAVVSMLQQPD